MNRRAAAPCALAGFTLMACGQSPPSGDLAVEAPASLAEHTREFVREVIRVTDGVHVAVGFGLANSILIEGDDGLIIVDTLETRATAAAVLEAFREISDKPVVAIIYTHNHGDHVFGAGAFASAGAVDVYAHTRTAYYIDRVINVVRPIITLRSARMFGTHLEGAALENAGIGPRLGLQAGSVVDVLEPTVTFSDRLETEIAGQRLVLAHAPGETEDQIFVWLPEKRVLLPGDNLYKTFPNLYTIRGTPYRDLTQWVHSLDTMRALRPAHLVPSHTRPVTGEQQIQEILTDYRDAIQFVHDQTVRGMNRGLTPDELVHWVHLPPDLAASPYLQEFYGTVAWSVRSVFAGYLGWFDGNPSTLLPLSPTERATRMAAIAGGPQGLREAADQAAAGGDHQWVLELTDHLRVLGEAEPAVRALRARALTALGEAQSNPNARHYYLTAALELSAGLEPGIELDPTPEMLAHMPLDGLFRSMAVNLDAAQTQALDMKVNFEFPDTRERYSVWLRRGVAEVQPRPQPEADITVSVDSIVWKEIVAGKRSALAALASGDVRVAGGRLDLVQFLGYFR